jgi:hypothetical protein
MALELDSICVPFGIEVVHTSLDRSALRIKVNTLDAHHRLATLAVNVLRDCIRDRNSRNHLPCPGDRVRKYPIQYPQDRLVATRAGLP